MERKTLKRWLVVAGLLYLVFPRDLVPDYLGRGLGLADDVFLIALLVYLYRQRIRRSGDATGARRGATDRRGHDPEKPAEIPLDPYAVLGIESSASAQEIRDAYRARMREYHPDKVAHLGEELQQVAHRKSIEIQRAYEELSQ